MLKVGDIAPSFTLPDQSGQAVSLRAYRGRKVVVYFYPADDTPTCTAQACEFRDAWSDVRAAGAEVLGISPDTAASHRRFRSKYGLPFPLLADVDRTVIEAYGVWGEKTLFGRTYMGLLRTTFVLDERGIVRHVFERVRSKGHAAAVLATLGA